jgi:hypothetical protein
MFLVSGVLVLWGALGQVATMAALICEFQHSGAVPQLVAIALGILALLLFVLLVVYGVRALCITANELAPAAAAAAPLAAPLAAPPAPGMKGEWPLL